jgi:hypothetical protein
MIIDKLLDVTTKLRKLRVHSIKTIIISLEISLWIMHPQEFAKPHTTHPYESSTLDTDHPYEARSLILWINISWS